MEEFIDENVGVLSGIFVVVRSIIACWICDYYEFPEWVWDIAGVGGANIPAIFLLEVNADEWNVPRWYQCGDAGIGSEAIGNQSGVGGFEATTKSC